MPNIVKFGGGAKNVTQSYTPSASNQTIAKGYHNGTGVVYGDADLVASNIKSGINIFGVAGTYSNTATVYGISMQTDDTNYGERDVYTPTTDLGSSKRIVGGSISNFRYAQAGGSTEYVQIQGSNDNSNWVQITYSSYTCTGNYARERRTWNYTSLDSTYRYVRIRYHVNWMGTGGHDESVWGNVVTLT